MKVQIKQLPFGQLKIKNLKSSPHVQIIHLQTFQHSKSQKKNHFFQLKFQINMLINKLEKDNPVQISYETEFT